MNVLNNATHLLRKPIYEINGFQRNWGKTKINCKSKKQFKEIMGLYKEYVFSHKIINKLWILVSIYGVRQGQIMLFNSHIRSVIIQLITRKIIRHSQENVVNSWWWIIRCSHMKLYYMNCNKHYYWSNLVYMLWRKRKVSKYLFKST